MFGGAGMDPEDVKAHLFRKVDALGQGGAGAGRPVLALLKQALSDLRPGVPGSPKERTLVREARAAIRSVIDHAQRMQERLARLPRVTLATAYRNKKELSERDKKLLDDLAEDLLKRNNRSRPKDGR